MKLEINIIDFLKTGKFGPVEINDSISTVMQKLGAPDGKINLSSPYKGIHYSMYEFVFNNNKLDSIQNDRFNLEYPELTEFENDTFKLHPSFLKADRIKTMKDIMAKLDQLIIEYRCFDYYGRKAIKTIGNVVIDFNDEVWSDAQNDFVKIECIENAELIGIRYFPNYEKDFFNL